MEDRKILEEYDFDLVCDGCENPASWVAYPGQHRFDFHDKAAIMPHLVCDKCRNMLMNASGIVCMQCKREGRDVDVLRLGEYYDHFDPLEVKRDG